MKVAIIGAGIAGLASLKSCKEEGIDATCFELTAHIGGLWSGRKGEDGVSAVYDVLVTNFNKEMMAFSDFPMPADWMTYLPCKQFHEYLLSYCEEFDLERSIKLRHKVTNVEQSGDYDVSGSWNVAVTEMSADGAAMVTSVHKFDAVMICTGAYAYPQIPEIEGMEKFKGRIIHSNSYTDNTEYKVEDRIMVIGNSHSGCDVATDLCDRKSRRDLLVDGVSKLVRSEMSGTLDELEEKVVDTAIDAAERTFKSSGPPVYVSSRSGVEILKRNYGNPAGLNLSFALDDFRKLFPSLFEKILLYKVASGFNFKQYGLISPRVHVGRSPFAINDTFYDDVMGGKIQPVAGVVEIHEQGVTLSDGESVEVDALIMATGYEVHFPFINSELIDASNLKLYKHMWPVNLPKSSLVVIGMFRVPGSSVAIIELQARWAVQVFKGAVSLPTCDIMNLETRTYRPNSGDHIHVQFLSYTRELSSLIGCMPTLRTYWKQPYKWWRIYFGPAYPYIYRLIGPGSCKESWDRIRTARSRIHPSPAEVRKRAMWRKKCKDNIFVGTLLISGGAMYLTYHAIGIYLLWKLAKYGWGLGKSLLFPRK